MQSRTTDQYKLSLTSTKNTDLEQLNLLEREADELLHKLKQFESVKQFESQGSPRETG